MVRWSISSHTDTGVRFENIHERDIPQWNSIESLATFLYKILPDTISLISLNLALPLDPQVRDHRLDGVLLRATKSEMFLDCIGLPVGDTLEALLTHKLGRNIQVTVANDTSCLLLAATEYQDPKASLGALIVGTGYNLAYKTDTHLINLEPGNMTDFDIPTETTQIDETSFNPGRQLLEKSISGHYLHHHYNLRFGSTLSKSRDLSRTASGEGRNAQNAKMILKESAARVAAQLIALAQFLETDTLQIVAEGSLFWHGYHYKEYVEQAFLDQSPSIISLSWISIPNSSLVGAAKLVMV